MVTDNSILLYNVICCDINTRILIPVSIYEQQKIYLLPKRISKEFIQSVNMLCDTKIRILRLKLI